MFMIILRLALVGKSELRQMGYRYTYGRRRCVVVVLVVLIIVSSWFYMLDVVFET